MKKLFRKIKHCVNQLPIYITLPVSIVVGVMLFAWMVMGIGYCMRSPQKDDICHIKRVADTCMVCNAEDCASISMISGIEEMSPTYTTMFIASGRGLSTSFYQSREEVIACTDKCKVKE